MIEDKVRKVEVKTYMSMIYCEMIGCGFPLERINNVLSTHPPQYGYSCPRCGFNKTSFVSYPKISYEEVLAQDTNK